VLTRSQKEVEVAELHDRFARATSVFVAEYRGLDVASVDALRARMRAAGAGAFEYRVAKNTLLRRAAEGSTGAALVEHFTGPTAVAFSFGDPAKLAKMLVEYGKDKAPFNEGTIRMDREDIRLAMDMFYREMGWDAKTGSPGYDVYRKFGLEEVARELKKKDI